MDEYIKREDALDAVLFALVGTGYQSRAIYAVKDVPTADVAPRAEVDKAYWEGVEYGHKDGAALVAREIFEEIKDQLRGIFDFFRQDNDIRESCAIMFALSEITKLKKKYTEDQTDGTHTGND